MWCTRSNTRRRKRSELSVPGRILRMTNGEGWIKGGGREMRMTGTERKVRKETGGKSQSLPPALVRLSPTNTISMYYFLYHFKLPRSRWSPKRVNQPAPAPAPAKVDGRAQAPHSRYRPKVDHPSPRGRGNRSYRVLPLSGCLANTRTGKERKKKFRNSSHYSHMSRSPCWYTMWRRRRRTSKGSRRKRVGQLPSGFRDLGLFPALGNYE